MAKVDHPVWLSIDWDAFIPEEQSWDWGHSEAHHPALIDALWQIRVAGALARGIDMRQLTAFKADMHPGVFWDVLVRQGYKLMGAKIAVADSHLHAAQFFMDAMADDGVAAPRILHVDAHHDLGYGGMTQLDAYVKRQRVEAGNWLGVFLRLFPRTKATLVLPSWSDGVVAAAEAQAPMTPSVRKRVKMQQWPALPEGDRVTRVFVCRSGAWSPPWHDLAFARFIEALQGVADQSNVLQMEPTEVRPWSDAAVEAQAAVERSMLEGLKSFSDARRTAVVTEE
jgi:hypothetical protein